MSDPRPAVLTVWNPSQEPRTIEVHVEHLRRRPDAWTWWGRIYGHPDPKAKINPSEDILDAIERSTAHIEAELVARGEATVLVTNFVSLHALRVTKVRGPKPRPRASEVPDYYANRHVLSWYRVADIRALSYDQASTIGYFDHLVTFERLRPDKRPWRTRFDPFAANGYIYPLPIWLDVESGGPFDGRPRTARFVDDAEAALPLPVQQAQARLARQVPRIWARARRPAQLFLAAGEASRSSMGDQRSVFGLRPAVLGLAAAVEREIRDEVVHPLLYRDADLARQLVGAVSARGVSLSGPITLGGMRRLLCELGRALAETEHGARCPGVVSFADEDGGEQGLRTDFSRLVNLRNQAVHANDFEWPAFEDTWRRVLTDDARPLLLRVLDARDEVGALLGGPQGTVH